MVISDDYFLYKMAAKNFYFWCLDKFQLTCKWERVHIFHEIWCTAFSWQPLCLKYSTQWYQTTAFYHQKKKKKPETQGLLCQSECLSTGVFLMLLNVLKIIGALSMRIVMSSRPAWISGELQACLDCTVGPCFRKTKPNEK